MNTIMNELTEFKKSSLGLYDSANGKSVVAEKVIDLIVPREFKGQAVVKYAKVQKGTIAQICQWYEKGKDLGMTIHYHISQMTPGQLSEDQNFQSHSRMVGYNPIDLATIIYENSPQF